MYKVIDKTLISFFDEDDKEIMYIDYSTDECVWYFNNSDEIVITQEMDLFEPLKKFISQNYVFSDNEILQSRKYDNKLVWYSDCYYNPTDEWSRNSVSYLTIDYENDIIKLKCTKLMDKLIDRKNKSHLIVFSPLGNGKFARNIRSGLTLQDEFVLMVYQELLKKEKIKKL